MRSRAVPSLTWSRCVRVLAWYRGLSLTAGPASRCCDDSSYETVLSLFLFIFYFKITCIGVFLNSSFFAPKVVLFLC
jgi:hypothetical protein